MSARNVIPFTPSTSPMMPAKDIGEAVHNLLTRGWTRLEYSSLSRRFEQVVATFIGMVNDPQKSDYMIPDVRELDSDGDPDLGLRFTAKGEKKLRPRPDEVAENRLTYDNTKALLHYRPRLLGYLGKKRGVIERHPEFFLESGRMYSEATLLQIEIAEELDRRLSGYGFLDRAQMTECFNTLRLLHYFCDGPTPALAQRHRDRCFLTIHIRSSRGGLWLADNNDSIVSDAEETRANSVLIFFGRKAWEITHGRLKGIVHGVRDTTFDDLLSRTPRQTAVFFGHVHVTKDDRSWAQEQMHQLQIPAHVDRFGL